MFSWKINKQTAIYCNSIVEDPNYKWKSNDLFTDLNKKNNFCIFIESNINIMV